MPARVTAALSVRGLAPPPTAWPSSVCCAPSPLLLHHPTEPRFAHPQPIHPVPLPCPQGLPAVKGSLFLALLGVKTAYLIQDLIILGCIYVVTAGGAVLLARLRLSRLRGRWF